MKRNFLLLTLAGAFSMALLASASKALAQCAQMNGNYAFKIVGGEIDTSTTGGNPSPVGMSGIGVFSASGCAVTGGEIIMSDATNFIAAPQLLNWGLGPLVPGFKGTLTGSNITGGSYAFATASSGVVTLTFDTLPSGTASYTFAVSATAGSNALALPPEMRGVRIDPGDILTIQIEQQAVVSAAEFYNPIAFTFEADGGGFPGGLFGVGTSGINGELALGKDPIGINSRNNGTGLFGGGNLFWNSNDEYFVDSASLNPGIITPADLSLPGGAFFCDLVYAPIAAPSTVDGTLNGGSAFESEFSCPAAGALFETSLVLWGPRNVDGFVITTGENAAAYAGAATATTAKTTAPLEATLTPGGAVALNSGSPTATLTLTNVSPAPMLDSSVTVVSNVNKTNVVGFGSDVTITGGTCLTPVAAPVLLASDDALDTIIDPTEFGSYTSCTIDLSESGCTNPNAACLETAKQEDAACTNGPNTAGSKCTGFGLPATWGSTCCTGYHTGPTCSGVPAPYSYCTGYQTGSAVVAEPYACCTGAGTGTCSTTMSGYLQLAGNGIAVLDCVGSPRCVASGKQTTTGYTLPISCGP